MSVVRQHVFTHANLRDNHENICACSIVFWQIWDNTFTPRNVLSLKIVHDNNFLGVNTV